MKTSGTPRWPDYSRAKEIAWVKRQRVLMPVSVVKAYKQVLAERIRKTREIFGKKLLIGDVHTHTTFSDGISSIAEIKNMADAAGLDFVFITDHRTLRHKRHCCEEKGLWWGQEPPTSGREIVLLYPKKLFVPRCNNLANDFELAQSTAPFVFIPHPVGYAPDVWYSDEVIADLWTLGKRFSIELINGHGKLTRAYDAINEEAVHVWEKLLQKGRQTNVVGGSDAHISYSVGTVWTGVYGSGRRDLKQVIKALAKGHSFASEAPLLWLGCSNAIMGDVTHKTRGARVRIAFIAADSAGLHSVQLIKDGKVVQKIMARNVSKIAGTYNYVVKRLQSYFRLECMASDQRRAFSSPLYIYKTL